MDACEMKRWIDNATIYDLLYKWRFSQAGEPFFQGEVGKYYTKVMAAKRAANPEGWVRASKTMGW